MKKVILLFGLLALLTVSCKYIPKGKKAKEREAIEIARKDSLRKDSIEKAEALALQKEQEAAEKARQEEIRKAQELERKNRFHVIAGSFKTPEYATAFFNKMQNEGYTVKKLKNKYQFEVISIYATDTYSKAYGKIKEIQSSQDEYVPLWVYEHN